MHEIESIISSFKNKNITVVLLTIPGLFDMSGNFSEKALEMGHLPSWMSNPYMLAELTERYNQLIINLANKHNTPLIHLSKWADKRLTPKDKFFIDSVHLTNEGQEMIGKYLAVELYKLFN